MARFGASFSVPYAQYLGLDPKQCLRQAIKDLGVERLRLMSYWNRLEPKPGEYDWRELDWQIDLAEKSGVEVTLCLGLRQPRWPESHWPDWALEMSGNKWQQPLLEFIEAVIKRYRGKTCIVSYQLENEALLKGFGKNGNFDRERLKREFELVKALDVDRPVIMSCSDSWGLPIFGPRPDMYGFSIYRYFYNRGRYRRSRRPALFYRLRAGLIRLIKWRNTFVHELQAEPWGPAGIPDMPLEEQFKSINLQRVKEAVAYARRSKLYPVDVWGLEWWYWLKVEHNRSDIWDYMRSVYKNS